MGKNTLYLHTISTTYKSTVELNTEVLMENRSLIYISIYFQYFATLFTCMIYSDSCIQIRSECPIIEEIVELNRGC